MAEMTRDEHLTWCKQRALEYVDRGDLLGAVTSMGSDLVKHEDWHDKPVTNDLIYIGLVFEVPKGAAAVRRWIEGWN
jgi:hypothetical protein